MSIYFPSESLTVNQEEWPRHGQHREPGREEQGDAHDGTDSAARASPGG